jgi:hypothetical protein
MLMLILLKFSNKITLQIRNMQKLIILKIVQKDIKFFQNIVIKKMSKRVVMILLEYN